MSDYSNWWALHRGSYYTNLQRFRDCFGIKPDILIERLNALYPGWQLTGVAGLADLATAGLNLDPDAGNPWRVRRTA